MNVELFDFQTLAAKELRQKAAYALKSFRETGVPQVLSLQAPTGAGKTIIMAAFVEDVFYGTEDFAEQPDAVFVWLSDSPQLNAQSRDKFLKSDKIYAGQCVSVEDENFDREVFDDGKIYFLNTQKITKSANLSKTGDGRNFTIWETIENTAEQKSDRLYFIIDEAHRGMQGAEAGKATSIMQRFLKGEPSLNLRPVPLVIGISATAERFNRLADGTASTLHKVIVQPQDVRGSGLLKDRIIITYSEDETKGNEFALLDAATDEWIEKTRHWAQYCRSQHYALFNPVFVIQVKSGGAGKVSDTNLSDVLAKIEERANVKFAEWEVVHTFGDAGTLAVNGLNVHRIEPNDIADDKSVKVVLFKENLSTGWDCPRAETMMSFRRAEDATYIAQLLGRMVRTPLQRHIEVDEYLNDVRLFLPHFNMQTVQAVIDELQSAEGGDIPINDITGEALGRAATQTLTVHARSRRRAEDENAPTLFDGADRADLDAPRSSNGENGHAHDAENTGERAIKNENGYAVKNENSLAEFISASNSNKPADEIARTSRTTATGIDAENANRAENPPQPPLFDDIDRAGIVKFINALGLLTYIVRTVKTSQSYLNSMLQLSALLATTGIDTAAKGEIDGDVASMIHSYAESLKSQNLYEKLSKDVLTYTLGVKVFDVFGEDLNKSWRQDLFMSESELDRQVRAAESKLCNYGFANHYGRAYGTADDDFKIDFILFAIDDANIVRLNEYARQKFHELNNKNRRYLAARDEQTRKEYDDIVSAASEISEHNFTLPEEIVVPLDADGAVYYNHLFADEKSGSAKIKLNSWEAALVEEEARRPDFVCWLRNPSRKPWALCVPYEMENETKAFYPDFLIVRRDARLGYVIDILEPHDPTRTDNLPKAKAFARYAEKEPKIGRVQLVRKGKDAAGKERFARLDFSKGETREKVLKACTNDELSHLFETDAE